VEGKLIQTRDTFEVQSEARGRFGVIKSRRQAARHGRDDKWHGKACDGGKIEIGASGWERLSWEGAMTCA
jgi:hypothetical protein